MCVYAYMDKACSVAAMIVAYRKTPLEYRKHIATATTNTIFAKHANTNKAPKQKAKTARQERKQLT